MGKLRDLANKLSKVTIEQQEKGLLKIVKDHEEVMTNMNTDQLFHGIRSDGSEMPPYSKTSVEVYGKPPGPIRLFDTGDFYRGFIIHADKFPVLFDSTDSKTTMLVEGNEFKRGYGEKIFGLTSENKEDLNKNYFMEKIQEFYKDLFKL